MNSGSSFTIGVGVLISWEASKLSTLVSFITGSGCSITVSWTSLVGLIMLSSLYIGSSATCGCVGSKSRLSISSFWGELFSTVSVNSGVNVKVQSFTGCC